MRTVTPLNRLKLTCLGGLMAVGFLALPGCADDEESGMSEEAYHEEAANDVCEYIFTCDCDITTTGTLQDCQQEVADLLQGAQVPAIEGGLTWDGVCADELIAELNARACGSEAYSCGDDSCEAPCNLYYGPMGKGGTCTGGSFGSNCKQGLTCVNDVCADPCEVAPRPMIGETCWAGLCEEGAWCNWGTNGVNPMCQALPMLGQDCSEVGQCADNCTMYCDGDVCKSFAGAGSDCTETACEGNTWCNAGTCEHLPGRGADCADAGGCSDGFVCADVDGNGSWRCESPVCHGSWDGGEGDPGGDGDGDGDGDGGTGG
jgi:hypothetical protein